VSKSAEEASGSERVRSELAVGADRHFPVRYVANLLLQEGLDDLRDFGGSAIGGKEMNVLMKRDIWIAQVLATGPA
jgi:hypothetical protein